MSTENAANRRSSANDCYPSSRSPDEVRIQWMRLYGMEPNEIAKSLSDNPPTDIEEEERELDSVVAIRERNADRCSSGCRLNKAIENFCNNTTADY